MKHIVITLGVVSEEMRRAIRRLVFDPSGDNYDLIGYELRAEDVENERRTFALTYHVPATEDYLRRRLTQMLKTRLLYEPPCNLFEVVAVVYDPSQSEIEATPHWEVIAPLFQVSVYRATRDDKGQIHLVIDSVAS